MVPAIDTIVTKKARSVAAIRVLQAIPLVMATLPLSSVFLTLTRKEPLSEDDRDIVVVRLGRHLHRDRKEPLETGGWVLHEVPRPGFQGRQVFVNESDRHRFDQRRLSQFVDEVSGAGAIAQHDSRRRVTLAPPHEVVEELLPGDDAAFDDLALIDIKAMPHFCRPGSTATIYSTGHAPLPDPTSGSQCSSLEKAPKGCRPPGAFSSVKELFLPRSRTPSRLSAGRPCSRL